VYYYDDDVDDAGQRRAQRREGIEGPGRSRRLGPGTFLFFLFLLLLIYMYMCTTTTRYDTTEGGYGRNRAQTTRHVIWA
jgi:hypothetical protein